MGQRLMHIRPLHLLEDGEATFAVWTEALGKAYPLDGETFLAHALPCLMGRPEGAFLAIADGQAVGFALTACSGDSGYLHALAVRPEHQRRGIGGALLRRCEEQLRAEGCRRLHLGRGPERFWTALPVDLPDAAAFFGAAGFESQSEVVDMAIDLRGQPCDLHAGRLAAAGAEVAPCPRELLPAVLAFEQREFPGWVSGILKLAAAGEERNVLVVRAGAEIVGTIQTFPPDSRAAAANLVWRRLFPGPLGGYGAVGIAKAWRGKGLGVAMCEAAGNAVRRAGAEFCFIDWTTIVDFYARVGAKVWRRFAMMEKAL